MSTTVGTKARRDLRRRPARAVLTAATIALSVVGIGLLAVPTVIDRTMDAEVRDARLYDITLPVRDMTIDEADGATTSASSMVMSRTGRVMS